jgi:hypothetical protein
LRAARSGHSDQLTASWLLTSSSGLDDDDHAALAQITTRREELKATCDLVREFADMLCHRHG